MTRHPCILSCSHILWEWDDVFLARHIEGAISQFDNNVNREHDVMLHFVPMIVCEGSTLSVHRQELESSEFMGLGVTKTKMI